MFSQGTTTVVQNVRVSPYTVVECHRIQNVSSEQLTVSSLQSELVGGIKV